MTPVHQNPLPAAIVDNRPALKVHDLKVSLPAGGGRMVDILHGVDFTLNRGETLAVVGGSGSGKSMMSFALMQLLPDGAQVSGAARLDGHDILNLDAKRMRKIRGSEIAMIFQEPMTSLNPVHTVGRQIAEVLRIHKGMTSAKARIEAIRLLERVHIPSAKTRYDDYPHNMSGGMRQRAMIAMALACRPRILIADEPTTALDVTTQAQILRLIRELQVEDQMGVLFITHDMGVVAEVADRVQVMRNGRIVDRGATLDLFESPGNPYTQRLLSAVPRLGSTKGTSLPMPFPDEDGHVEKLTIVPPKTDEPVLEVKNLITRFEKRQGWLGRVSSRVHAVEDVSFTLKPGQTLSIVGESGSGKSTTARSILRLNDPTSGQIFLNGTDIATMPAPQLRDLRRGMQMIFQDPYESLDPRVRIGETIMEPMLTQGTHSRQQASAKVKDLLQLVGLSDDMAARFPHEFSGGQRQRVSIARALALDPGLVIADEAVSALDVAIKAQIVNLMLELQARLGLAYLFISHDMSVVERISHRVAVMYCGRIVEIGSRRAIFETPSHAYTRKLLAAVPVPDPTQRREQLRPEDDTRPSQLHPSTYVAPPSRYIEIGPDHFILDESTATA